MKPLKELMDLTGMVAIVTGGSGHIGFAMAEAIAELGAKIVLTGTDKRKCDYKAKNISRRYKTPTLSLTADFTKEDSIKKIPGIVLEKLGRIDILINCAAILGSSDLEDWSVSFERQSAESWRKVFEVNLTAVFILTQSCKKALENSGSGSVINVASIYGMVGPDMGLYKGTNMGNLAAYGTSKGGLIQLTRWLATVLAPKIRVNAITPGGVFRGHKDPFLGRYKQKTPLGRMAKEQDFKGAAMYLASGLSAYVTGHNLVVDGGWSVW